MYQKRGIICLVFILALLSTFAYAAAEVTCERDD